MLREERNQDGAQGKGHEDQERPVLVGPAKREPRAARTARRAGRRADSRPGGNRRECGRNSRRAGVFRLGRRSAVIGWLDGLNADKVVGALDETGQMK